MRLVMRERSLTRLSRSRLGRLASSSSMVGIATIPQCPRSPRNLKLREQFLDLESNIQVSVECLIPVRVRGQKKQICFSWRIRIGKVRSRSR
jgi:hypothetical protein